MELLPELLYQLQYLPLLKRTQYCWVLALNQANRYCQPHIFESKKVSLSGRSYLLHFKSSHYARAVKQLNLTIYIQQVKRNAFCKLRNFDALWVMVL